MFEFLKILQLLQKTDIMFISAKKLLLNVIFTCKSINLGEKSKVQNRVGQIRNLIYI